MTPTFALPQLLWLLLLPLALLAWEIAHTRRAGQSNHPKILRGRAGARDFELLGGQPERFGRAHPRLWLCLGLALTVVALARPQYGLLEEQVFDQSREIMIAVDLSKSMLAEDVKPSRLGRAKLLIQSLLERLAGERVGLVLFSGTAFVQSPLSADYEILNEFLPVLEPGYLPAGGSNYGALLRAANESFGPATTADRFLIVLSDGEATDEEWRGELPGLKERGIRVIGLGVGTAGGSMIPDGSGGFIKDERGAVVMSKLENATLQELAKETNGAYEDASGWVDIAALMQGTVEAGQKGAFKRETRSRLVERYQWALAPALLFLLISYWREFPARPKPRELRLLAAKAAPARPTMPAAAGVLAVVLLLAAGPGLRAASLDPRSPAASPARPPAPAEPPAAGDPGPPAENPVQVAAAPLARAVDRISRQTRRAAADWAELARLTINYGNQLLTANEEVPEAPVRDSLQAVELGAALDAKAADWPALKQQLEELLKKKDEPPPEEPPPPPPDQQNQEQQKQNQPGDSQSNGGQPQEKSDQNQDPSKDKQDQDKPDQEPQDQEQKEDAESAFGDMDEPQPEEQNPTNQPPPKNETQQVGGQQQQARNENPSLTVPLQHLDELRNRDNPADLFQLMDDQPPPKPTGKDW